MTGEADEAHLSHQSQEILHFVRGGPRRATERDLRGSGVQRRVEPDASIASGEHFDAAGEGVATEQQPGHT